MDNLPDRIEQASEGRREIFPRGKAVTATKRHFAIAKGLYEARPFVMTTSASSFGAQFSRTFEWDAAPAYYQNDMLELAHFAIEAEDNFGGRAAALRAHGGEVR